MADIECKVLDETVLEMASSLLDYLKSHAEIAKRFSSDIPISIPIYKWDTIDNYARIKRIKWFIEGTMKSNGDTE